MKLPRLPWQKEIPLAAPSERGAVLLASPGKPISDAAVAAAVRAADGRQVRVVSTAKIFGTALGLQHPGLLPNRRELAVQEDIITDAVKRIEHAGGRAKGELIATRDPTKAFYRAAVRYAVEWVVLDPNDSAPVRRLLEGDPASSLRRRLRGEAEIEVVERS
jgi:hypothetical protein